eukprot:Sspe_Gene.57807::Locus_31718_Transcript_1_1_Confidence_1.000_Length_1538::g.57807::m.57807
MDKTDRVNLECLLARLREDGMTTALEGELGRARLHAGTAHPFIFLLRIIICAVSPRALEHLYQNHEWFLVPPNDAEFVRLAWKVLLHEFRYKPRLTPAQFSRDGYSSAKLAVLFDVLRLVERLHNWLVRRGHAMEAMARKRALLIGGISSPSPSPTLSPSPPPVRRRAHIREAASPSPADPVKPPPCGIYKKPGRPPLPQPIVAEEALPSLLGGTFTESTEALRDTDPLVQGCREDHPAYRSTVEVTGTTLVRRGHCIPRSHVVPVTRGDGMLLHVVGNVHLPHGALFTPLTPGVDYLHRIDDAVPVPDAEGSEESCDQPSAPPPVEQRCVRIKGIQSMLERTLVKRIKRVAPTTFSKESAEMYQIWAATGSELPEVRPPGPGDLFGTFWEERADVLDRLIAKLQRKYEPSPIVLVNAASPSVPTAVHTEEVLGMKWSSPQTSPEGAGVHASETSCAGPTRPVSPLPRPSTPAASQDGVLLREAKIPADRLQRIFDM